MGNIHLKICQTNIQPVDVGKVVLHLTGRIGVSDVHAGHADRRLTTKLNGYITTQPYLPI